MGVKTFTGKNLSTGWQILPCEGHIQQTTSLKLTTCAAHAGSPCCCWPYILPSCLCSTVHVQAWPLSTGPTQTHSSTNTTFSRPHLWPVQLCVWIANFEPSIMMIIPGWLHYWQWTGPPMHISLTHSPLSVSRVNKKKVLRILAQHRPTASTHSYTSQLLEFSWFLKNRNCQILVV